MRITLTNSQSQALVTLLTALDAYASIDIYEAAGSAIRVTYWRGGDPTSYRIAPDGETREEA